jgi:hypothetical protein
VSSHGIHSSYHNNTILESQYRLLLSASGCTDLQCLRTIDSASLKRAAQQTYVDAYNSDPGLYAFGDFYYGPSVDGDLIRDLPSNEWKQGHFTKVPLIVDHDGYVRVTIESAMRSSLTPQPGRLQLRQPKHNNRRGNPSRPADPLSRCEKTLLRQTLPALPTRSVQQYFLATPISLWRLYHQLPDVLYGQCNG